MGPFRPLGPLGPFLRFVKHQSNAGGCHNHLYKGGKTAINSLAGLPVSDIKMSLSDRPSYLLGRDPLRIVNHMNPIAGYPCHVDPIQGFEHLQQPDLFRFSVEVEGFQFQLFKFGHLQRNFDTNTISGCEACFGLANGCYFRAIQATIGLAKGPILKLHFLDEITH